MAGEAVRKVMAVLDAMNADDPVKVTVNGQKRAQELVFADRLEAWIRRLEPSPSNELLIAARGQHVRRWTISRKKYPEGRSGYLRWREDLKRMHADAVDAAMRAEGLDDGRIAKARAIVMKQDLAGNPDAQTMEDALCLVFLETQFEDLLRKTLDDKMVDIIKKTWRKMSAEGRTAALALKIPDQHRALIERALT
jgi:hypothetical protein